MLGSLVTSTHDPGTSKSKHRPASALQSSSALKDANVAPITRTTVCLEYASLRYQRHCPLGMYVVPSVESILVWDAVLFVHQGYYADSILKFRLNFPANYPDRPPVVQFFTDVFHPLISQSTGLFNLAPRFRPWRPKEHHVFHVLHWIKAAFKKHALDGIKEADCSNKEAFRYHDSTSSFSALATQTAMLSQSSPALFDRDHPSTSRNSVLSFHKLESEQLKNLRAQFGLQEWESESTQI